MIEIGNSVISGFYVGNTTPARIDVGGTQVWPAGVADYIYLDPTTVLAWNGYQRTDTISVTASTNNWSVEASSTPAGILTATKTNNNTITWTMLENTGTTSCVGYVTATCGSASAVTTIYQNPGYYIYVENSSPQVVGSGSTTLGVSVISRYGTTAVPVTYQINGNDWVRYSSMIDAGNGHYIYNFTIDTNTDTQARHNSITFTQTQGQGGNMKSATLAITQQAMYEPATIAGFERFAYEGDWQLGRALYGTTTGPSGTTMPLYAILLLNVNATAWDYSADLDFDSYTQVPPSAPSTATTNTTATIPQGATVSIPNGDTAYGIMIKSPSPNQRITTVRTLHVTRAT